MDWLQWSGSTPPDPTNWDTITYTYDPAGRRIKKNVVGSHIVKYVYDGGHVIAEYDDSSLLRKYIYGARVDEPVCMIDVADSNAAYYYHFDGLGSVVALSNSNGDSCQSYEYSAYGQVAASDPDFIANPYMFTGRRFDIETGLYYYRARYYNPHIGRFMQTDPVGYGAGINWYLYCGNNPLAFVDPSGMIKIAFYDPTDDHGPRVANGAQFKESADDFGEHAYAMKSARDVIMKLAELKSDSVDVDEVYFFDHCHLRFEIVTNEEGIEYKRWKVTGLEFGDDALMREGDRADGGSNLEVFGRILSTLLPEDSIINFRHCYVALNITEGESLLEDLAEWTNRTVTGATGAVTYFGPRTYKPNWERPGPDHVIGGQYWKAFTNDNETSITVLLRGPYKLPLIY